MPKNGRVRTVPLNSLVHDAFTRHPHPPDAEWVFTTTSGIPYKSVRGFYNACKAADLAGLTPHSLRHTFVSRFYGERSGSDYGDEVGRLVVIKMLDWYATPILHGWPRRSKDLLGEIFTPYLKGEC